MPPYDSHQQISHHVPMHVGEAVVAALELESQPVAINAETVRRGRAEPANRSVKQRE